MNWHYAENNTSQGPVGDAEFESLIRAGRVQATTLVWHDGMAEWRPLSEAAPELLAAAGSAAPATMPPTAAVPVAPATPLNPDEVLCAECGQRFFRSQTIMLGGKPVCAGCKPKFVQRMAEGVPLAQPTLTGQATEEQILGREYRIELGEALGQAQQIYGENAGLIIGTTAVFGLAAFGIYVVSAVIGMIIPFGNALINLAIGGPLAGGFLWFLLRLLRREPAVLSDAFAGFTRPLWNLVLCSVVQGLISMALFIPVILIVGVSVFTTGHFAQRGGSPDLAPISIVLLLVFGLAGTAVAVWLNTLWTFGLLLVVDKGYGFWDAMQLSLRMVKRRWWMTFLFVFVINILAGLGALLCLVGLLYTAPLAHAAKAYLYDQNFRDLTPKS